MDIDNEKESLLSNNHKLLLYIATRNGWKLTPQQTRDLETIFDRQTTKAIIICYHHNLRFIGEYQFREFTPQRLKVVKHHQKYIFPHCCYSSIIGEGTTTVNCKSADDNCHEITTQTVKHPYKFHWVNEQWIESTDSCGIILQKWKDTDVACLENQQMTFKESLIHLMNKLGLMTHNITKTQQHIAFDEKCWNVLQEQNKNTNVLTDTFNDTNMQSESIHDHQNSGRANPEYYIYPISRPKKKLNLHRARSRRKHNQLHRMNSQNKSNTEMEEDKSNTEEKQRSSEDMIQNEIHELEQIANNNEIFSSTQMQQSMLNIIHEISDIYKNYRNQNETDEQDEEMKSKPKQIKNIPTKSSTKYNCVAAMYPLLQDDSTTNSEKLRVLQSFCVPMSRWKNWTKRNFHKTVLQTDIEHNLIQYKKRKRKQRNNVQSAVYNFVNQQGSFELLNTQNYWNYRQHYTKHRLLECEDECEDECHDDNSIATDDL
eukprot:143991_1